MKLGINDEVVEFDDKEVLLSLTNREAMDIERVCGCTYNEWQELLKRGSAGAVTAFVWVALRRNQPDLRYDAVEFTINLPVDPEAVDEASEPVVPPTGPAEDPSPVVVEDNP